MKGNRPLYELGNICYGGVGMMGHAVEEKNIFTNQRTKRNGRNCSGETFGEKGGV